MTVPFEVGHAQTPQADLAPGCLHFLKNGTQHTLSPLLFCARLSVLEAQSNDSA